jgi:YVTN family beta-propeller protein
MQHEGDMYMMHHAPVKKPTWVIPAPDGEKLYVTCNGADEVAEVDLESWSVTRTFKTGKGPYNVEVAPDGRMMVVTYKSEGQTGLWDLEKGEEVARVKNTRNVPHGIAITPDGKYAFVTVEGIGGEPGTVDIIDLHTKSLIGSVDVGKQAGGIAFWKMMP